MAKWYGEIGFGLLAEDPPESGCWVDTIIPRNYYGDVIKNSRRLQITDHLNDDVTVSNEISIVSDEFANSNFYSIRYAEFMGTKWKVTNVDASEYPRLVLSLGGIYNEQSA